MPTPRFAAPEVEVEARADGVRVLRSPGPLGAYPEHLGVSLRRWAEATPDRTFLAERAPEAEGWVELSWAVTLERAEALGEGLLSRGAGPNRPLVVLSGNSIDHALLMFGSHLAGIPIAPISPAYSLLSTDHGKLCDIVSRLRPGIVFVDRAAPFAPALADLDRRGALTEVTLVVGDSEIDSIAALNTREDVPLHALPEPPGERLRSAEAEVGLDTVAKILFTSGSTDIPKGVLNTHRMLCSNQQMIAQVWPFLRDAPPVLVDWLPWNHTFGANHNVNLVLTHGGTLYIDAGKPAPGLVETTVDNLRDISPTLYFNVPAGFAQLLPHLEADAALRDHFFGRLQLIFYAGAALPQDLWNRLEALSKASLGETVTMVSAWGSTETSPASTTVHFPIDRAGVIGLPLPGVEIKMVPAGSKQELRVRGPHVFPGYLDDDAKTRDAFDDEGFYRIGDAGKLADPDDPSKGVVFDGRVAEDFKLLSGTWVNAGRLRVEALAAAEPVLQDAVITGHDRDAVGLLAWLNIAACRALLRRTGISIDESVPAEDLARTPTVREHLCAGLTRHNADAGGSSRRIARVLLLVEPPSIDAGEITDKGYINQREVLDRRADDVERLYADPAHDVLRID
ncbi:MAG: feruloyl-CoA synthase [Acidobacteriota bacterium]